MEIKVRVEIYPKEISVPGIRIRIPESYIKRLAKSESGYPQLFIKSEGLKEEFGIEQIIIAVENEFFLPKEVGHKITTTAHGERKVVDDVNGSLDSYLAEQEE